MPFLSIIRSGNPDVVVGVVCHLSPIRGAGVIALAVHGILERWLKSTRIAGKRAVEDFLGRYGQHILRRFGWT